MPNDKAGYLVHVGLGHIFTAYYVSGVPKSLLAPFYNVILGLAKESDVDMDKVWSACIAATIETVTMTNSVLGMLANKPAVDVDKVRLELEELRANPEKFNNGFAQELLGMLKNIISTKEGRENPTPEPEIKQDNPALADNPLGLNLQFRKEDIRW